MVQAESLRVEVRLDVSRMAIGHRRYDGNVIKVAGLAIRHAEIRLDSTGRIMTCHTIQHLRQGKVFDFRAGWDGVVTGRAVEIELILLTEVRNMRKIDADVFAIGHLVGPGKTPNLRESRVFDLFGSVTAAAALSR